MERKELARTRVFLPEIALGTSNYKGVFIDTAGSYGSEEVVGEIISGICDRIFPPRRK